MMKKTKQDWLFEEKFIIPCFGIITALLLCYLSSAAGNTDAVKMICLMVYLFGTVTSISLGHAIKQIAQTTEEAVKLNNSVHRWSVAMLNSLTGIGCALYLVFHPAETLTPAIIFVSFFILYFLSWALRVIRPHSLLARYRSVLTRVVLTAIIAGIISQYGYWVVLLASIPFLIISWRHLRRDQAELGWNFR